MLLSSEYDRDISNIPGTAIHIYAILMTISIILVIFVSWLKMYRRNIPTVTLEVSALFIVISGLLGARFWYVLNNTNKIKSFIDVFAVWNGGMAIQGGVAAGAAVGWIFFYRASKKYRISMWVYLDCIIPNILLGQAIGRWGNFFNQEVLGSAQDHPFSWLPDFFNQHLHYYDIDPVSTFRQPLFLYESVLSLFGWILITFIIPKVGSWVSKKPWKIDPNHEIKWNNQVVAFADITKKKFLFHNYKAKKIIWKEAYYEYEPEQETFSDQISKKQKLIIINFNDSKLIKLKKKLNNLWIKTNNIFARDASALNKAYNPNNYRVTYAGTASACYFIFYGIIRTILEPFRDPIDLMMINGVATSVVISCLWIIFGIILLVFAQFIASRKFRKKGWYYERQY